MKFHHIWGVKQKNSPYMLRIIVFCAVKIANREKETETRKGDRIDDQTRKFNLSEAVSLKEPEIGSILRCKSDLHRRRD